jgi:hypothetical protein
MGRMITPDDRYSWANIEDAFRMRNYWVAVVETEVRGQLCEQSILDEQENKEGTKTDSGVLPKESCNEHRCGPYRIASKIFQMVACYAFRLRQTACAWFSNKIG